MEEVIGFGVIGLLVISLVLGVRKLFKKKRDLFDYEDEIILDKKMLHLGPFSGSFVYPHRKSILLLAVSSSFLSADIELRTIDNWGISSWGEETLVLQKTSDNYQSNFYIEMDRPFCICTDPIITTPSGASNYNIGDKIEAVITVDTYKPKKAVFEIKNIFEDVQYKGIDLKGNRYIIKSKFAEFELDRPEIINMKIMKATFYFKDGKTLKVTGDTGTYNNKTNDMEFRDNVKVTQADNRIFADNLDYFNLRRLIKVYGNVVGKSLDGNFTSDILNLNIDNQSVDALMINNEQVKINLRKWKRVLE